MRRLDTLSTALAYPATAADNKWSQYSDTVGNVPSEEKYTLPPDPWTNTPDGHGTGGPLPPRLTMSPEELYLYELHGYL